MSPFYDFIVVVFLFIWIVLCFCTFINMRINVKGLSFWIDAAVSVKFLADRQRSVLAINTLVCQITNSQVLEIDILKENAERRVKHTFSDREFPFDISYNNPKCQYPVNNVVDVIIHIFFCVQCIAPQPLIFVSF